jgi:hypothetical protein
VSADEAKIGQYEKEVAEKVKPSSLFASGVAARQGAMPGVPDDDPWSEYFGSAYGLFNDDETAELEPGRDGTDLL